MDVTYYLSKPGIYLFNKGNLKMTLVAWVLGSSLEFWWLYNIEVLRVTGSRCIKVHWTTPNENKNSCCRWHHLLYKPLQSSESGKTNWNFQGRVPNHLFLASKNCPGFVFNPLGLMLHSFYTFTSLADLVLRFRSWAWKYLKCDPLLLQWKLVLFLLTYL